MRKRAALSCLLAAAAAASGCGSGSSSSGTRSIASTAHSAAGFDGVPVYQPSRTVKRSSQSLALVSPDSVATVDSFYASMLASGGWVTVAKQELLSGEIRTVKRGTVVASVLIARKGTGAKIDIAAYSSR